MGAVTVKNIHERTGLHVGEKAPLFTAKDHLGNVIDLRKLLAHGPVVLVLYRGQWCPICNKHLQEFQSQLALFQAKGASVIAVTPETQEFIEKTIAKTSIAFPVIHDEKYEIMEAYDVAFEETRMRVAFYNTAMRANFRRAHGDETVILPVPATYVIGTDGLIKFVHFDPDYRKRSNPNEILAHL